MIGFPLSDAERELGENKQIIQGHPAGMCTVVPGLQSRWRMGTLPFRLLLLSQALASDSATLAWAPLGTKFSGPLGVVGQP